MKKGQTTQWRKEKRTHTDLQNSTHKTNDRATQTSLKPMANSDAPEKLAFPAPCVTSPMLLLKDTNIV